MGIRESSVSGLWRRDQKFGCRHCVDKACFENLLGSFVGKRIKVSDAEIEAVNLTRHDFHGEWNYTISPKVLAVEQ